MKALILVALLIPHCAEARPGCSLGSASSKLTGRTDIAARLGASAQDQAEVGVNHKVSQDVDVGAKVQATATARSRIKGELNGGVQVDEQTRIAAKYDGNVEVGAGRQINENPGLNARVHRGEDGKAK
ncbi:hypothetical protein AAVH_42150, partial [Aphelenchoides avenae]